MSDRRVAPWFMGMLAALATGTASAQIDLSGNLSAGVEHNSNPFELGGNATPPVAGADDKRSDTSQRLSASAAVESGVTGGPLHIQMQGQITRVEFSRFETLDNTVYGVDANVNWRPTQAFDATLQASDTRAPIRQADVGGTEAALQTTRQASATLRVRPMPRWQIGVTPAWMNAKQPLPGADDFELRETSGTVTLDYLGVGPVTPGVLAKRAEGRYSGIPSATRYEEETFQGTVNYRVTDFSTFSLAAGHTRRSTRLAVPSNDPAVLSLIGSRPAFTGSLTYERRLTPKTAMQLNVFRDFQQYDAGVNTAVGTGFSAGLDWAPTSRFSMRLGSQYTWSTVEGLRTGIGSGIGDRKDLVRSYVTNLNYNITRNVSVQGYAARRMRNSTLRPALFNTTVFGMNLGIAFD